MTSERVVKLAEINGISCEVRRIKRNWVGHVIRREADDDCLTTLRWTPEGRRARGRPKTKDCRERKEHGRAGMFV